MMYIPEDDYYTQAEILVKLGYTKDARPMLHRSKLKGKLKPFYIGSLVRYRKSENLWVFENDR